MGFAWVLLTAAIVAAVSAQTDDDLCLKTYTSTMGITTSLSCRSFCYTKFLHPKCVGDNCTCVSETRPSPTESGANLNCQKEIRFDGDERANISCTSFCWGRNLQAKCEGDYCRCMAIGNIRNYPTLPPLKTPVSSDLYHPTFVPPTSGNVFPFMFEVPVLPSKSEFLKRYKGRYIVL